jgi:hypothetical protein
MMLAACQPVAPVWRGQGGWRMGAYDGPMMHYGYCPGAPTGANGAARGWHGPGMMGGGGMMGGRGADIAGSLESARAEIGITAAQEPAWSAYVEAAQADRTAMAGMHDQMGASMMGAAANAPERLQAHLDLMSGRLASLQAIQAATRALYDVLTPEQRQRADQALWSGCW